VHGPSRPSEARGLGRFIVNIMDKIKAADLPYKYENELH